MKKLSKVSILGIVAVLSTTILPKAFAASNSNVIVPGQSIGQTYLGANGTSYLNKLPKANAVDVGMSQTRQVWVSKQRNRTNTLFIHTVSNGALGVQPINGVTIDNIRITSSWFHTSSGDISTGSTKAKVLKNFPGARPVDGNSTIYDDAKRGIAFEFPKQANDKSPCIAIMIHPKGNPHLATTEEVSRILSNGEHP